MPASASTRLHILTALALCASALSVPAPVLGAASSVASSASQSVGVSIGSVSGSLKGSSNSSSPSAEVAAGDYEVVAVAAVVGLPERRLLTLRAKTAARQDLVLELPRQAVEQGRLVPGGQVQARARPYGVEFASGETREAFFLLLDDEWFAELSLRALGS